MHLDAYHQFTQDLRVRLESDPRVLALVALGSMAEVRRVPDEWSDHDFFVITVPGVQEQFRQDVSWLPEAGRIALRVRETAHGLKVLYDDGHVLEFAIFDEQELFLARVNDYRVLFERSGGVAQALARIQQQSAARTVDLPRELELFFFHLLLGAARCARGEILSGHRFIKTYALDELLTLLVQGLPGVEGDTGLLDNLDPFRRVERVFPELGARLNRLLLLEPIAAATEMLALAEAHLRGRLPAYPEQAARIIRERLASFASARG
ncbi:hypothetical protein JRI60_50365 [Archangium violaceum]|uniref:hypothetical protein n=1 Tax=Archangium violaceum TaxID=83451 RepID=UPI00194E75BA|nr:hypothetical protein [Archangium violaceum]QRN97075.1 hypothetical protein JRI60_50365 [Archangium violaceum]